MRYVSFVGIVFLLFLLMACGQDSPAVVESLIVPTSLPDDVMTPTPAPTAVLDETESDGGETAVVDNTQSTPRQPSFANLSFQAAQQRADSIFVAGTQEVFAQWAYADLSAEDVMRRVWFKNGEEWLVREEAWNFAAYGPAGTISDISVYDFETGLDAGEYKLTLYLNDLLMTESSFWIDGAHQIANGDGGRLAYVANGRNLYVRDDASVQSMAQATEIVELVWMPDGVHLLYVDLDRSEQVFESTIGLKHAVWLVNTDTGMQWQLGFFDEDLHVAQVAENGRYIAFIAGTSYGDACFVDRTLYVMELDVQYQRTDLLSQEAFWGIPLRNEHWFYPQDNGEWQGESTFRVAMNATCLVMDDEVAEEAEKMGIYEINLETREAFKVGDLPDQQSP